MQRPDASAALAGDQARMADAGLKPMIPFRRAPPQSSGEPRRSSKSAGGPFLDYVLSALADAGCLDVCLVIGPDRDVVREHYVRTPPQRVRVSFAVQAEPRGTADAVLAAEAFAGGEPFLVLNGDNYYPVEAFRALAALDGPGLPAFHAATLVRESNIDPERLRSYALLRIAPNGDLEDIVEKPDPHAFDAIAGDVYVSMNCWRFGPSIFRACRAVAPSPRGELELPDAVRYAIRTMGERFRTIPFRAGVLDLSRRADVAEVGRRLEGIEPRP
jgi:glucose-1-phosphate thymidylyltransferase